jgi:large subunit ribosomal protein L32e
MKFVRSEGGKRKRLADVWRTPRGQSNKLRRGEKGKGEKPNIGYKKQIGGDYQRIFTVEDVKGLKVKVALIGSGVGLVKRAQIVEACKKVGITVLNAPANAKIKSAKKEEAKAKKEEVKKNVPAARPEKEAKK